MESRGKVEDVFRRRFPDDGPAGFLARADYARMLSEAGLKPAEVEDLLRAWDPSGQERLAFNSFLDFVYDQGAWQASKQSSKQVVGGSLDTAIATGVKVAEEGNVSEPEPEQENLSCSEQQKACNGTAGNECSDADAARLETTATTCAPSTPGGVRTTSNPPSETVEPEGLAETVRVEISEAEEVELLEGQIREAAAPDAAENLAMVTDTSPVTDASPMDDGDIAPEEESPPEPEEMTPRTPGRCVECMHYGEAFQDPMDLKLYCRRCWIDYYCPDRKSVV